MRFCEKSMDFILCLEKYSELIRITRKCSQPLSLWPPDLSCSLVPYGSGCLRLHYPAPSVLLRGHTEDIRCTSPCGLENTEGLPVLCCIPGFPLPDTPLQSSHPGKYRSRGADIPWNTGRNSRSPMASFLPTGKVCADKKALCAPGSP